MATGSRAQVVLVTGSSSGLGRACCDRLVAGGHRVYGASRSMVEGAVWTQLRMDVTETPSVQAAVGDVLAREERIDALIHCVGLSVAGALEDVTPEEAKEQFETNYFGTVRMVRAVLPAMRQRRHGRLIVVGSIGGLIGLPFVGHYSASKFALEGLMQALRLEIAPFGVEATIVHPGDFKTAFGQHQIIARAAEQGSAYEKFRSVIDLYDEAMRTGSSPDQVAAAIERLLHRRRLPVRLVIGTPVERAGVFLRSVLPARAFERIIASNYKL